MKHFPPEGDGMTFVDLVFPAFLFIVGMSIPFAINKRRQKGDTTVELWKHIFIRTAGLLTLGIFMVNIHGLNEALVGMSRNVWELLMFISAEDAMGAIINGFCKDVFRELPGEFAVEATQLLGLKLEGAVG